MHERQPGFTWPHGCRAAVSLTYDDALPEHHAAVAPLLERAGLRATFYLDIRERFMASFEAWRSVARQGHELGNHSLFHPCRSDPERPMSWLDPAYNLCHYGPQRWRDEMRLASFVLRLVDGHHERTFGNTCCDVEIGTGAQRTSLEPLIDELFLAGRGPLIDRIVTPTCLNLAALGHFSGDGMSFEQLRQQIEAAIEQRGWIIFMFHGVGPAHHRLHIDVGEHERLVRWLGDQQSRIWTAPVITIARRLRAGHAR